MLPILWCAFTIGPTVDLMLPSMGHKKMGANVFPLNTILEGRGQNTRFFTYFAAPHPVQAVEIVYLRVSIDNHVDFNPPGHLASSIICLSVQSLE